MPDQAISTAREFPLNLQQRVSATFIAGILGVFIIYGVGFAQSSALHNAAHDGRHAHTFPCH